MQTETGELAFQHYFVREQCKPEVTGFTFDGISVAKPQSQVIEALTSNPKAVLIAPSNPYVSVDPILNLPGMRDAIKANGAPVVAVSPIIGGQAVKGPAAKMMKELGKDVSVMGIAQHYHGLTDGLVIDNADAQLASQIEAMGISVRVTQTLMSDVKTKINLSKLCLDFANELSK